MVMEYGKELILQSRKIIWWLFGWYNINPSGSRNKYGLPDNNKPVDYKVLVKEVPLHHLRIDY